MNAKSQRFLAVAVAAVMHINSYIYKIIGSFRILIIAITCYSEGEKWQMCAHTNEYDSLEIYFLFSHPNKRKISFLISIRNNLLIYTHMLMYFVLATGKGQLRK